MHSLITTRMHSLITSRSSGNPPQSAPNLPTGTSPPAGPPTNSAVLGAAHEGGLHASAHHSAVLGAAHEGAVAARAAAAAAAAVASIGSSLTDRNAHVAAASVAAAARPDTATDDDVVDEVDSSAHQTAPQTAPEMAPPLGRRLPASIRFAWEHPQRLLRGLAQAQFSWGPDEQKALEQYVISIDLP